MENLTVPIYNCYFVAGTVQTRPTEIVDWTTTNIQVPSNQTTNTGINIAQQVRLSSGGLNTGVFYLPTEAAATAPVYYLKTNGSVGSSCDTTIPAYPIVSIINNIGQVVTISVSRTGVEAQLPFVQGVVLGINRQLHFTITGNTTIAFWPGQPDVGTLSAAVLFLNSSGQEIYQLNTVADKGIVNNSPGIYTLVVGVPQDESGTIAGQPIWVWILISVAVIFFIIIILYFIRHMRKTESNMNNNQDNFEENYLLSENYSFPENYAFPEDY